LFGASPIRGRHDRQELCDGVVKGGSGALRRCACRCGASHGRIGDPLHRVLVLGHSLLNAVVTARLVQFWLMQHLNFLLTDQFLPGDAFDNRQATEKARLHTQLLLRWLTSHKRYERFQMIRLIDLLLYNGRDRARTVLLENHFLTDTLN